MVKKSIQHVHYKSLYVIFWFSDYVELENHYKSYMTKYLMNIDI